MEVKKLCLFGLFILFLVLTTSSIHASEIDNSTDLISEFQDNDVISDDDIDFGDFNDRGEWTLDENGNVVMTPSTKNHTYTTPDINLDENNTSDLRNDKPDKNVSYDSNQSFPSISSPAGMIGLWKEYVNNPEDFLNMYHSMPDVSSSSSNENNNSCNNHYSKEFLDFMNFVKENKDKPNAIESKDIKVYYSKNNMYKVRILNPISDPVGKGVNVTFVFNGKKINVKTDSKGYASFKFNCQPGKYVVKINSGNMFSKKYITVNSLFKTKNINKIYKKPSKFTVKLIKQKGKSVAKQIIKITFKGKTYKVKSNSKGFAVFNIPKNIKVGKYTIKTSYNGCILKNKVIVKR